MITHFTLKTKDKDVLSTLNAKSEDLLDNKFDYSQVLVTKPWGYEYLIFQNKSVAVWILYLKDKQKTSMHCHPNKKTSLIVLEGKVKCLNLDNSINGGPGDAIMIDKGVFHQTEVISNKGAFIMEIESPVNKLDLVRYMDKYNREGKGYETVDKDSYMKNYNYLMFGDSEIYYNQVKHFGSCSISIKKLKQYSAHFDSLDNTNNVLINLLSGNATLGGESIEIGDTFGPEVTNKGEIKIDQDSEILIINKNDSIIKLSDFVVSFLYENGVNEIFFVPGDANLHLVDSLGRHEKIQYLCSQTERVASIAAESYAKEKNKIGIVLLSSGASGTNALTGVANAWTDSTPMMVISGQASLGQFSEDLRQLGNKSLNIIDIVKPITKYAKLIRDPLTIKYELMKALNISKKGRPGPVWIDIPIDIQGKLIDKTKLRKFSPVSIDQKKIDVYLEKKLKLVIALIQQSSMPVILAGGGIRLSDGLNSLTRFVNKLKIPVLLSRRGADLLSDNYSYYYGRPGAYGQRKANIIIQNCDLLISLGCRLSIPQIGRNYNAFAKNAKKIIVDIDQDELFKKTIHPDIRVNYDVKCFLDKIIPLIKRNKLPDYEGWIKKCNNWSSKFIPEKESMYKHRKNINPYLFINRLSKILSDNDIIIVDGGPVMNYVMQVYNFKVGQRLISSNGIELPGFALAGAIGCSLDNSGRVICICEDRGFQINISDIQTIIDYELNMNIFVLKSKGHSNIRKIQREYFGGRYIGTETDNIFGSPDMRLICQNYGLKYLLIEKSQNIDMGINSALNESVSICEVIVDNNVDLVPRIIHSVNEKGDWISNSLDNMYPYIDIDNSKYNMNNG